jgi:hypothetical protein
MSCFATDSPAKALLAVPRIPRQRPLLQHVVQAFSQSVWETKWSVPWFDCDESLTLLGLNLNPGQFCFVFLLPLFCFVFLLHLFRFEKHVCLSCGMQVAGAAWHTVMRIMAGVGDLVQRIGDGRTGRVFGGRAIERSGGAVCGLHRARGDVEHGLLGWASKPRSTVCEWFGLKTNRTVFAGLTSKPVATVSSGLASKLAVTVFSALASKPVTTIFSSLASKLVATVSPGLASKPAFGFLVEPQNWGGGGFPGLSLKTGSSGLVIWASKSPRRFLGFGLKTMWTLVCRLRHKTDGGRSA